MSEICCDLCKFWLPELKECGNTHIDKCVSKKYFVRTERNCGTCEREVYNGALDDTRDLMTYHQTGLSGYLTITPEEFDKLYK